MRRLLILGLPLLACVASVAIAEEDTAKAAATRKVLKNKVTVDFKEETIGAIVDDDGLKDQLKGVTFDLNVKSGLNRNTKVTISMKDKPFEEVLKAICDKNGWGYYIISNEKNAYDGRVVLKVGKERGYEEGKEPTAKNDKDKGKAKDKKEAKKTDSDEKKEPKEKAEPKDKAEPKERPQVDDEDKAERSAAIKLKAAKELIDDDKKERAIKVLEDLLDRFPKTKAAEEAKELLEKLKK